MKKSWRQIIVSCNRGWRLMHLRVSSGERDWLISCFLVGIKATSRISSLCSVMMASFWRGVLLGLAFAALAHAGNECEMLSLAAVWGWNVWVFLCCRHETRLWARFCDPGVDGEQGQGRYVALPSGLLSSHQLLPPGGCFQGGSQRL